MNTPGMEGAAHHPVYEFGEFRLDPHRQLLTGADGAPVALSPRAFDLAVYLAVHAGELIDKPTLMKAVWPGVVVEENNLSQQLAALRRALRDGEQGRRYLLTVPGRGVRFVAEVRTVKDTRSDLRDRPIKGVSSRAEGPPASVAVLPFVNVSGDPEKEYFGDGIADELIHLLARVPGLKVPARTSSFAYKGRAANVRDIARDLAVSTVVEGSVRSVGSHIRVTAQLISADTGFQLWSRSFDREFENIFALQGEIAISIVEVLRQNLHAGLRPLEMPAPPTKNLAAYELYLQARAIGEPPLIENVQRAVQLQQRAFALDTTFARAIASAAIMRAPLVIHGVPGAITELERDAARALELDPTIGDVHAVLGVVNAIRRKWLAAAEEFRAAQEFGIWDLPGDPYVLYLTGAVGYVHFSRERLRTRNDTPPSAFAMGLLCAACLALPLTENATEEALHLAGHTAKLSGGRLPGPLPIVFFLGSLRLGRRAEALVAASEIANRISPQLRAAGAPEVLHQVHRALADRSRMEAATASLRGLLSRVEAEHFEPNLAPHILTCLTMLGALDDAFEFANRVIDAAIRSDSMGMLLNWLWTPELLPFRRDLRFQALVERLNLIEYWSVYGPPDDCELENGRLICL